MSPKGKAYDEQYLGRTDTLGCCFAAAVAGAVAAAAAGVVAAAAAAEYYASLSLAEFVRRIYRILDCLGKQTGSKYCE